jgi:hypothetical protein
MNLSGKIAGVVFGDLPESVLDTWADRRILPVPLPSSEPPSPPSLPGMCPSRPNRITRGVAA